MEKEKVFTLRITQKELRHPSLKNLLSKIMEIKLKLNRNQRNLLVSSAEHEFMRFHWSWANVESYAPKKKDRLKGEVGKYLGKRVRVRGIK